MFIVLNNYNNYNYKVQNYFTVKARVVVLDGLAQADGPTQVTGAVLTMLATGTVTTLHPAETSPRSKAVSSHGLRQTALQGSSGYIDW